MYERLTHRDSKGDVWIKDAAHVDEQGQICMLSDRLAAYEDSGLSPEQVQELAKAKADGRMVELPCKVGEKLYVLSPKQYSVGNDHEYPDPCEECEIKEPYEFVYAGTKHHSCKLSYDGKCPTVVKPITVEVFEIRENNTLYPCYTVAYEGNSSITDWHITRKAAEKALGGKEE